MRDFYERFEFLFDDEEPEHMKNYRNNHRGKPINDPLDIVVHSIGKGISDTLNYMFFRKMIDKAVKDAVINSGGEWTD